MLRRKWRNIVCAVHAITATWREEPSFRVHVYGSACLCALGWFVGIARFEWAILILALAAVLTTEIINTAIERIGDVLTRENDPLIGFIKDLGTAAVGVIGLGAIASILIIFAPYLLQLLQNPGTLN